MSESVVQIFEMEQVKFSEQKKMWTVVYHTRHTRQSFYLLLLQSNNGA